MESFTNLDILLSILVDLPSTLDKVIELNSKILILEYENEQLIVEQNNLSTFICPLCNQNSLNSFKKQIKEVKKKIKRIEKSLPLLKQSLEIETIKLELISECTNLYFKVKKKS